MNNPNNLNNPNTPITQNNQNIQNTQNTQNTLKNQNTQKPPITFLPQHGHYRHLRVYQVTEIIYDITYYFTQHYLSKGDRTVDQMVQAARSGKQNIAEGNQAAATSSQTEIKLTNVAKASLEELLNDYEDYLRAALFLQKSVPSHKTPAKNYPSSPLTPLTPLTQFSPLQSLVAPRQIPQAPPSFFSPQEGAFHF